MISVSSEVRSISHPLIKSLHIRQEFDISGESRKILVLQASFSFGKGAGNNCETKLMNLLTELNLIAAQAEEKFGCFDCIDIEPERVRNVENISRHAA